MVVNLCESNRRIDAPELKAHARIATGRIAHYYAQIPRAGGIENLAGVERQREVKQVHTRLGIGGELARIAVEDFAENQSVLFSGCARHHTGIERGDKLLCPGHCVRCAIGTGEVSRTTPERWRNVTRGVEAKAIRACDLPHPLPPAREVFADVLGDRRAARVILRRARMSHPGWFLLRV